MKVPFPQDDKKKAQYEQHKANAAALQREKSYVGRNIAPIPPIKNPERRAKAMESLEFFAYAYFPETFNRPCSPAHKLLISKLEEVIIGEGGNNLQAIGMPRGWGKTSWCRCACLWGLLRGSRKFLVLIAANASMAKKLMKNFQNMLECPALLEDFPEAIYPITRLDHTNSKAPGQHIDGKYTNITRHASEIVFPSVANSLASGAIVCCAGLDTGHLRGLQYVVPSTGATIRPDVFLADDVQTKKTSKSQEQCKYREDILASDVMFMGGSRRIAGLATVTCIQKDDVADHLLDRKRYPAWNGIRCHYFDALPSNMELWEKWWDIKKTGDNETAVAMYLENREAMDKDCIAVWPEYYEEGYVSAIEQGMAKYFDNRASFQSEYQSEPLTLEDDSITFDTDSIEAKAVRNRKRGQVPTEADILTASIDVHGNILYTTVGGFSQNNFTGSLIDYGTWPKQKRAYFRQNDTKLFTLKQKYPGRGDEGAVQAGLVDLINTLLDTTYKRDDGVVMHVRRILIDSGYKPSVIHNACRMCKSPALVMPCIGKGVRAKDTPISQYKKRAPGDRLGPNWWVHRFNQRDLQSVMVDTNHFKSQAVGALSTYLGDPGCLSMFESADKHKLLIAHLLSERCTLVEANGRRVYEWEARPEHFDNHWLDCLVYMLCAASMEGCTTTGKAPAMQSYKPPPTVYMDDFNTATSRITEPPVIVQAAPALVKVPVLDACIYETYYPFG